MLVIAWQQRHKPDIQSILDITIQSIMMTTDICNNAAAFGTEITDFLLKGIHKFLTEIQICKTKFRECPHICDDSYLRQMSNTFYEVII